MDGIYVYSPLSEYLGLGRSTTALDLFEIRHLLRDSMMGGNCGASSDRVHILEACDHLLRQGSWYVKGTSTNGQIADKDVEEADD